MLASWEGGQVCGWVYVGRYKSIRRSISLAGNNQLRIKTTILQLTFSSDAVLMLEVCLSQQQTKRYLHHPTMNEIRCQAHHQSSTVGPFLDQRPFRLVQ